MELLGIKQWGQWLGCYNADMGEKKDKIPSSLNVYVSKVRECNSYLADQLIEGPGFKEASLKVLREMDLPRFNTEIVDVVEYLNDPQKVLAKLRYDRYFANIIDKNSSARTKRVGLGVEGINDFLNEVVEPSKRSNFQILLSECPNQLYNGVLIVDSPNRFFLEMIKGQLPEMVTGNKIPDYTAFFDRDNLFDLSIKYTGTDDITLKMEMYKIIQLTKFRKGYYEFCLADIDGKLKPFFFEYSDKKTYSLDSICTRKDYSKKGLSTHL